MIQAAKDRPMKMGATVDNNGMVFMQSHVLSSHFLCAASCVLFSSLSSYD